MTEPNKNEHHKRMMQILQSREVAETRLADLMIGYPVECQQAGTVLLNRLADDLSENAWVQNEFMYTVAWLGCQRAGEIDKARAALDKLEGESEDDKEQLCV